MNPRAINVLTGATATGKTALALVWAQHWDAEIVSCDSLLFYRGMDIGTAKPTREERAHVPHHLIDVCDVGERMDVKTYVERARAVVGDIEQRGRRVLVVGGSGFYLRSFFSAVTDDVPVDPALRRELETELQARGREALVERLRQLNPAGLGNLDTRNARRVLRALERCMASGLTLVELANRFRAQPAPFADRELRLVEITRDPAELRARIAQRAQQMIADGLCEEVGRLRAQGLEQNPSAAAAIGYRETLAWLDAGEADRSALVEAIARNTWRLVRKQRTWFRTQLPPHRVVRIERDEVIDPATLFA